MQQIRHQEDDISYSGAKTAMPLHFFIFAGKRMPIMKPSDHFVPLFLGQLNPKLFCLLTDGLALCGMVVKSLVHDAWGVGGDRKRDFRDGAAMADLAMGSSSLSHGVRLRVPRSWGMESVVGATVMRGGLAVRVPCSILR